MQFPSKNQFNTLLPKMTWQNDMANVWQNNKFHPLTANSSLFFFFLFFSSFFLGGGGRAVFFGGCSFLPKTNLTLLLPKMVCMFVCVVVVVVVVIVVVVVVVVVGAAAAAAATLQEQIPYKMQFRFSFHELSGMKETSIILLFGSDQLHLEANKIFFFFFFFFLSCRPRFFVPTRPLINLSEACLNVFIRQHKNYMF